MTTSALFTGFLSVGLSGFGGVLPWARRMLVQQRKWLSEAEFREMLSLCQLLPGPNIVNVSICVGNKFGGAVGALAAFGGLMAAPVAIVLILASFYARYAQFPAVHGLFRGITAAAAGLVVATGIKMAAPYRKSIIGVVFLLSTFILVVALRWPLFYTLIVLGPLSIAAAWRRRA